MDVTPAADQTTGRVPTSGVVWLGWAQVALFSSAALFYVALAVAYPEAWPAAGTALAVVAGLALLTHHAGRGRRAARLGLILVTAAALAGCGWLTVAGGFLPAAQLLIAVDVPLLVLLLRARPRTGGAEGRQEGRIAEPGDGRRPPGPR